MNSKDRDMYIFNKIIKYCFEADATIQLYRRDNACLRDDLYAGCLYLRSCKT